MSLAATLSFDRVRAARETPPRKPLELTLATRHLRVAKLIAEGKRNKQIAAEMGLTLLTTRGYVTQLFKLTGLTSRVEVANWVRAEGAHDVVRMLKAMGVAA